MHFIHIVVYVQQKNTLNLFWNKMWNGWMKVKSAPMSELSMNLECLQKLKGSIT